MYNPDVFNAKDATILTDSPEIAVSPDRKKRLDDLCHLIHDELGYGVTRVGDRITIRKYDESDKMFQICLLVLEVELDRDMGK